MGGLIAFPCDFGVPCGDEWVVRKGYLALKTTNQRRLVAEPYRFAIRGFTVVEDGQPCRGRPDHRSVGLLRAFFAEGNQDGRWRLLNGSLRGVVLAGFKRCFIWAQHRKCGNVEWLEQRAFVVLEIAVFLRGQTSHGGNRLAGSTCVLFCRSAAPTVYQKL